jgi:hypothetical protein
MRPRTGPPTTSILADHLDPRLLDLGSGVDVGLLHAPDDLQPRLSRARSASAASIRPEPQAGSSTGEQSFPRRSISQSTSAETS